MPLPSGPTIQLKGTCTSYTRDRCEGFKTKQARAQMPSGISCFPLQLPERSARQSSLKQAFWACWWDRQPASAPQGIQRLRAAKRLHRGWCAAWVLGSWQLRQHQPCPATGALLTLATLHQRHTAPDASLYTTRHYIHRVSSKICVAIQMHRHLQHICYCHCSDACKFF